MGLDQSLLQQHDLQYCGREFPLLHNGPSTVHLYRSSPLLHTRKTDRKDLKMLKIVCLLSLVNLIYQLTTSFVWLRVKYSKVSRERTTLSDSQKTPLFFFIRSKGAMQLEEGGFYQMSLTENNPIYIVLPNGAGNIIQVTYKTF